MRSREPLPQATSAGGWFVQIQIGQPQVGHLGDAQTAAQHEDKHGPVTHPVVRLPFWRQVSR